MEFVASIFGYVLNIWYDICQNYGIAIILFSLTIKALMIPLTLKQQKSMKLTQEMQPKLLALQEKYKDNQEAMMLEYQKLMSENKYNPFGGCLLTFIQLPILIGVFFVVASPLTYMEKMEQTEIDTYIEQSIIDNSFSGDKQAFIAAYEEPQKAIDEYKTTNRYYELKLIKENNLLNLDFFGINLGDVASENKSNFILLIIPVLTTVFLYLSLYVVSGNQNKQQKQVMKDAEGNEIPMPNMMAMNFVMPLMSGYISYVVPQGMGLYWFTNSMFQIIIQIGMKKFLDKDSKPKMIEEKKK